MIMDTPPADTPAPKVFISYSWDDPAHKSWVLRFATRLRADGVDVMLDHWHAVPGDQLAAFMERAVRENDYVVLICSPSYKTKSDGRSGGVGYEGDIMTAEAYQDGNHRKFIPVLRRGEWRDAAPSWVLGKFYIDLRSDPLDEASYEALLKHLHNAREAPPPIGTRPAWGANPHPF